MKRKTILLTLIGFIIFCMAVYLYVYKDHRNIEAEPPAFTVNANAIGSEFLKAPLESEKKYLNKTIIVSGGISEINQKDLTLNDKVFCQFNNALNEPLQLHSEIKLKGRVIGYDELLEQVKLDQCVME